MNTIWYKKPAQNWKESFPVGNGRLGAMVYGNPDHEIIELNEESVWSKPFTDRNNKAASSSIKNVRNLVQLNRLSEAQELVYENFTGVPKDHAFYKSAGKLHLDFFDGETKGLKGPGPERNFCADSISFYKRELNLETATASTIFTKESSVPSTNDLTKNTTGSSITYTTEVFAPSYEDVIVVHITASTPKSIYLRASFESNDAYKKYSIYNDTIVMENISGVPYSAMLMASTNSTEGKICSNDNCLIVEKADEVTLYIDVETAYRKGHYNRKCGDVHRKLSSLSRWCSDRALKKLCYASSEKLSLMKKAHLAEASSEYKKVNFSLTDKESILSVEELFEKGNELLMNETYWKFSRYVMTSASKQPATLPPLKNGIWHSEDCNEKPFYKLQNFVPEFSAGYVCNFKKASLSLLKLYKKLYKHGKKTSFEMYGVSGIAAHGSTDLWGDTSPYGEDLASSYSCLGALKICRYILDGYEYTLDKKFLKKHFKFLQKTCSFFEKYLVLQNDKKDAVLIPSFEQHISDGELFYIGEGSAKTNAEIYRIIKATIKASEILKKDQSDEEIVRLKSLINKLHFDEQDNIEEQLPEISLKPEYIFENNFAALEVLTRKIIDSKVSDDAVEISIFGDLPSQWKEGQLTGVSLRGNIYANVKWSNGTITSCELFTKTGRSFVENIVIVYKGKKYNTSLSNGTLEVLNVLPSTL